MNIKDFLIDNYIWILVIILITIITIIGFLADKKSRGKKEKKDNSQLQNINNQQVNNQMMNYQQQPIQYQQPEQFQNSQPNNNIGFNFNNMNTTVKPLNQMNNTLNPTAQPNLAEPMPLNSINNQVDLMNNINPINNVTPNNMAEPMYQPLSEQKPNIAPQPIQNIPNMQQPVNIEQNQISTMPNNLEGNNTQTLNVIPSVNQNIIPTPVQTSSDQTLNMMPMYNANQQVQQIENFDPTPNFIPNNTTIPTPVNPQPIPVPKQVIPQPIMQNNYNQLPPMQQNLGVQPNQQLQQPIQQQGQTMAQQPINFVYGSQNTNQNM